MDALTVGLERKRLVEDTVPDQFDQTTYVIVYTPMFRHRLEVGCSRARDSKTRNMLSSQNFTAKDAKECFLPFLRDIFPLERCCSNGKAAEDQMKVVVRPT